MLVCLRDVRASRLVPCSRTPCSYPESSLLLPQLDLRSTFRRSPADTEEPELRRAHRPCKK